jgi:DNA mismatch repair protein MutS
VLDDSLVFDLEAGRHPVVEAAVRAKGEPYTPNALQLDGAGEAGPRLLFVTGPNMAGKSTYLRQCALMAILAQAGCPVPAARLRLGLVDRVFSRVGASDDLARGRSTFMVEMIETAAILNQAGPRALVVLDEIGRGTATYDGLAIAWATAERLHDVNRCRALFATHYHELTSLAARLDACANASLKAQDWNGDLVFLHEVRPGPADRSYGVQVGRLAGLPGDVVARAGEILARLEAGQGPQRPAVLEDLPLFAASRPPPPPTDHAAVTLLREIDPDRLTPREALDLIYRLAEEARRG